MPEGPPLPDEESGDIYSLDIDDAEEEDAETAIRQAVEAVEAVQRRPDRGSSAEAAREPGQTAVEAATTPELEQLQEELEEMREHSLRTLADFENYRKRTERDREEARLQAVAELLQAFLDVIDNLERALDSRASGDDLRIGVEMIFRQMQEILRRFGVEAVEAMGSVFDPALHEAVMRQESPEVSEPTVVQELQRGYLIKDRLLRPARVGVAVPVEEGTGSGAPTESGDGSQEPGEEP